MNTLVDWELARRIAHKVADRRPLPPNYNHRSMERDFAAHTAVAEELVAAETGLVSLNGPARGKVTTRAGWIDANIKSFQRLLKPLADRLAGDGGTGGGGDKNGSAAQSGFGANGSSISGSGGSVANSSGSNSSSPNGSGSNSSSANGSSSNKFSARMMQKFAALEVGAMLGWMSTRVLGQYDLLVIENEEAPLEEDGQDVVYYVAPNIAALEWRHGFPPDEFRLWIALHEVTHRAQFTGVAWLREHFLSLVDQSLNSVSTDPKAFGTAMSQIAAARREGRNPFAEGGIAVLVASPEQREVLDQIMGMMSLLEGHGDVTMDRAGAEHLSEIPRFRSVISHRRSQVGPLARLMRQMMGIEAKMNQYAAGERFIAAVEEAGGTEFLDKAWEGPECLPSMAEIRDPSLWIDRVSDVESADDDEAAEKGVAMENGEVAESVGSETAQKGAELLTGADSSQSS